MIQTILTPIDGSKHAQTALDLSTDLAVKTDAQLVLLHVSDLGANVPKKMYEFASRELEEAEESGRDTGIQAHQSRRAQVLEYMGHMLLRDAREHAENKGVGRTETVIDFGDAGKQIVNYANNKSADLIIMGSRGLSKLKGLLLGSVSNKVFHLAPCSCVVVRRSDTQSTLEGIKKILVPTDGSEQADKAVDLASDIAVKYGSELALMYVTSRGPSLESLRSSIDMDQLSESTRNELDPSLHPVAEHVSSIVVPPIVSKDASKEIAEQVLERGRQTAEAKGVRSPELILKDGDPAHQIVGAAKRSQADMIAMGSRGLGDVEGLLIGSVSYKVGHAVPCSCMIVR